MTSILVSRFILNLRDAAASPTRIIGADVDDHVDSSFMLPDKWWHTTDAEFLAPLGSPLDHSFGRPLITRISDPFYDDEAVEMQMRRKTVIRLGYEDLTRVG